jgi:hypothetical protein
MLYRPELAQEAKSGTSTTMEIDVTFTQRMMVGSDESECRTPLVL